MQSKFLNSDSINRFGINFQTILKNCVPNNICSLADRVANLH